MDAAVAAAREAGIGGSEPNLASAGKKGSTSVSNSANSSFDAGVAGGASAAASRGGGQAASTEDLVSAAASGVRAPRSSRLSAENLSKHELELQAARVAYQEERRKAAEKQKAFYQPHDSPHVSRGIATAEPTRLSGGNGTEEHPDGRDGHGERFLDLPVAGGNIEGVGAGAGAAGGGGVGGVGAGAGVGGARSPSMVDEDEQNEEAMEELMELCTTQLSMADLPDLEDDGDDDDGDGVEHDAADGGRVRADGARRDSGGVGASAGAGAAATDNGDGSSGAARRKQLSGVRRSIKRREPSSAAANNGGGGDPGHLSARANILRTRCIQGLGRDKFHRAHDVLKSEQNRSHAVEEVEALLGDDYERFAPMIEALVIYESAAFV